MATCEVTVRDTTLLQMKATAGKTNNLLSWNKIPSADGYRIYGGECGAAMKLIKTVSAGTQSWNHSGLKAGKAYRYCVKAYRIVNGTETVTKTSNTVHSITASSKFTNAKSVTVSETSVALQVGESKNLGAKVSCGRCKPYASDLIQQSLYISQAAARWQPFQRMEPSLQLEKEPAAST